MPTKKRNRCAHLPDFYLRSHLVKTRFPCQSLSMWKTSDEASVNAGSPEFSNSWNKFRHLTAGHSINATQMNIMAMAGRTLIFFTSVRKFKCVPSWSWWIYLLFSHSPYAPQSGHASHLIEHCSRLQVHFATVLSLLMYLAPAEFVSIFKFRVEWNWLGQRLLRQ